MYKVCLILCLMISPLRFDLTPHQAVFSPPQCFLPPPPPVLKLLSCVWQRLCLRYVYMNKWQTSRPYFNSICLFPFLCIWFDLTCHLLWCKCWAESDGEPKRVGFCKGKKVHITCVEVLSYLLCVQWRLKMQWIVLISAGLMFELHKCPPLQ
jgi:hypothetical protein